MGIEVFQVELSGGDATAEGVIKTLGGLASVVPDTDSMELRGSTYFLHRDGRHVIEMEITEAPMAISCRFTLCHPPSIDAAFLEWVRELMQRFGMRAKIRDDVTPEHAHPFSLEQFDEFAAACRHYIALRRREWQMMFGIRQLAATTTEAHQHIIIPLCERSTEKAG